MTGALDSLEAVLRAYGVHVGRPSQRASLANRLVAEGLDVASLTRLAEYALATSSANPAALLVHMLRREQSWRDYLADIEFLAEQGRVSLSVPTESAEARQHHYPGETDWRRRSGNGVCAHGTPPRDPCQSCERGERVSHDRA